MESFKMRVEKLYREAKQQALNLGMPLSKHISGITINRRAVKRLGSCKETNRYGKKTYQIEVSSLLEGMDDDRIKDVIYHELLHTCPGCMNHGKRWKHYADILNTKLGCKITATADYQTLGIKTTEAEYRYVIVCENCGLKGYRMRKSNVTAHPENYKCSKCGGPLKVLKYSKENL